MRRQIWDQPRYFLVLLSEPLFHELFLCIHKLITTKKFIPRFAAAVSVMKKIVPHSNAHRKGIHYTLRKFESILNAPLHAQRLMHNKLNKLAHTTNNTKHLHRSTRQTMHHCHHIPLCNVCNLFNINTTVNANSGWKDSFDWSYNCCYHTSYI